MKFIAHSRFVSCLVLLGLTHSLSHAQTAYLLADRVFEGDIVELIIEYDNKIPSLYALELSQLQTDFEVLEVRSRVSRVFESNQLFNRMQWQLDILPRRNGRLSIPPLQVGDIATPRLKLDVEPQSSTMASSQNVFVEISAEPLNPYPGQQIKVVTRLFHNIPLLKADFAEPEAEQGDFYRSGEDSSYSVTRDGAKFNVLERRIAFIARTPGNIELSPAVFRGQIKSERESSQADLTTQTRLIYRRSETLQLQVRNFPPGFDESNWLPARQLEIRQHWQENPGELKVGDSFDITLSIEARGLAAEALPAKLMSLDSIQVKIYPDLEKRSDRFEAADLIGRLDQRYALVVLEPGQIRIPDLSLKWWDVDENAVKVALLEGRTLNVIGAQGELPAEDETVIQRQPQDSPRMRNSIAAMRDHWRQWLLAGAVLMIGGVLFGIPTLRRQIRLKISTALISYRSNKSLRQACLSNDASSARRELINWARLHWPGQTINGLHEIAVTSDSIELAEELLKLDAALYADVKAAWRGKRLWQLITVNQPGSSAHPETQQSLLPGFYPQRC